MTRIKRQDPGTVTQRKETWATYEPRWPRYKYEILDEPKGTVATVWAHRPRKWSMAWLPWRGDRRRRLRPTPMAQAPPWPTGGVFVPKGWTKAGREPKPRNEYDLTEVADEILTDAQSAAGGDPKTLLHFVNRWGVLGVGVPGYQEFSFDGVELTHQHLSWLKERIEALGALRGRRQTSATWADLAFDLNSVLGGIHPAARPTGHGLVPVHHLSRLWDALCFRLWERATESRRLRRCPECRTLFFPRRVSHKYCTRRCVNRITVRRWRRKQKRQRRASGGQERHGVGA